MIEFKGKKIFEVSDATKYVVGIKRDLCIINDNGKEYEECISSFRLINENCKNFGSTIQGRIESAECLTGIKYKTPIILCENQKIIVFPMGNHKNNDCTWFFLKSIKKYQSIDKNKIEITFMDDQTKIFNYSYYRFKNQISKAQDLFMKYYYRK